METLVIVVGACLALGAVVQSADALIHHAVSVAEGLHVPAFTVGVLIVGVGTSSPEAFISAFAGLDGKGNLSAGNAAGSNIVNTALLAMTLLIFPLLHHSRHALSLFGTLLLLHLLVYALIQDNSLLSLGDGAILVSAGLAYVLFSLIHSARQPVAAGAGSAAPPTGQALRGAALGWQALFLACALAALLLSSHYFVELAVIFCERLGVSDLVLGLTVVAIGTSLPEVSASYQAARRGATDISLGNMLGSMTFNLSFVLAFASLSGEARLDSHFLGRDFPVLLASLGCCALMYAAGARPRLLRLIASATIALYLVYTLALVRSEAVALMPAL